MVEKKKKAGRGSEEGRGLSMGGDEEEVCLSVGWNVLLGCRYDDDADGRPFLCSYHTILRKGERESGKKIKAMPNSADLASGRIIICTACRLILWPCCCCCCCWDGWMVPNLDN